MREYRQTQIRRELLTVLSWIPQGILLPDRTLRADTARRLQPAPTTAELDVEIREADAARLMAGIPGEDALQWQITPAGRLWLAQNP